MTASAVHVHQPSEVAPAPKAKSRKKAATPRRAAAAGRAANGPTLRQEGQGLRTSFRHTCQATSTHSADVDYADLLPSLFQLKVGNFYIALAGEPDRERVLKIIQQYIKPDHRVFVGVVAPIDPRVEAPEDVRDRTLEAARYIPIAQLGTTDDCGFSPFSDDTSTTRDTAFAKIRARVEGTRLAGEVLEGR